MLLPSGVLGKIPLLPEERNGRKPTLLHATLALPPPSTLAALYARRLSPETLLSVSLHSRAVTTSANSGPPSAAVLAHVQHDNGRYSIEGLGSSDNALLGVRGLYNFGVERPSLEQGIPLSVAASLIEDADSTPIPQPKRQSSIDALAAHRAKLLAKPSLLSAGGEFYYSPTSHVIGLSTGLRFTTLAPHIRPSQSQSTSSRPLAGTSAMLSSSLLTPANIQHSSFPYTMTLTLTPLTGSLASSYSVQPPRIWPFPRASTSMSIHGNHDMLSELRYGDVDDVVTLSQALTPMPWHGHETKPVIGSIRTRYV